MKDFIFGTLATEELRIKHVRARRAGVSHSYARSPLDPSPGQEITLELAIGPGHPCEKAVVYWTTDGSDPHPVGGQGPSTKLIPMEPIACEWDTVLWGYIRRFQAVLPGQPAGVILRYCLAGISADGRPTWADEGTVYACYIADDPPPSWSQQAIVYQIFVDRFSPGSQAGWLKPRTPSGFYGGTLRGILEKLDYLQSLGVNVLWLTPLFPSPSHHGYDATDLTSIEPRFGTIAEFQAVLDAAHHRQMRVLLDLVPNHVSNRNPIFQSAIKDKNSPYARWFSFSHWPDKYASFFGVAELPQLNLSNPEAKQYLLDSAAFWLKLGVDGYRVDYAIGPVAGFWADFRKVTRETKPDCWTFGEVVEPPDSQLHFAGGLDGCLDFNLLEGFRQAFAYGVWDAQTLASFITRHEAYFPQSFSRPSFLDNHDMNRFLCAAGGDERRLRLAALCQFSLSGPPVIYYGTEVGLSQQRDVRQGSHGIPEESRLPMLWDEQQNQNLLQFYRQLIQFRNEHPALTRGTIKAAPTSPELLFYSRGEQDELLVVLNLSGQTQTTSLPGGWTVVMETHPGDVVQRKDNLKFTPLGGAILEKQP